MRLAIPTDVQAWREALARQDWEAAFDLYRGPLLAGLEVGATAEFSGWLEHEREAITRAWHEGLLNNNVELVKVDSDRAARLLLVAEVVLPDGSVVSAIENENPDLFLGVARRRQQLR